MGDKQRKAVENAMGTVGARRRKLLQAMIAGGAILSSPLSSSVAFGDESASDIADAKKAGKKKAGKKKVPKKKVPKKKAGKKKKAAKKPKKAAK